MESNNEICKQIDESLDAFHDGELSAPEVKVVEEHLKTCAHCAAKLAEINRLVHALRTMPRVSSPSGLTDKLDTLIDRRSNVVAWRGRAMWASAAVAAVAVIVVGTRIWSPANNAEVNIAKLPNKAEVIAAKSTESKDVAEVVAAKSAESKDVAEQVASHRDGADNEATTRIASKRGAGPTTIASAAVVNNSAEIDSHAMIRPSTINSEEIAELPTISNSFTDAVGLTTDEDGLYDIQM